MKPSREELEKDYERIYKELCSLVEGLDVCGFKELGGTCYGSNGRTEYCCCGPFAGSGPCRYFVKGKGCGTHAVACKTWFCFSAKVPSEVMRKIDLLKEEAARKGFYGSRWNFDDAYKNMTKGGLI